MAAGVSWRRDGGVLRIQLDKPEKLNAVNTPMLAALRDAISVAGTDDSIRVVTLTGAGRGFCSGGDMSGEDTDAAAAGAAEVTEAITASTKPVVAGVRGAAVGVGCSLVLACDLAVVARSAFFQLAFAKVGLMTDGGISALLPATIGRARAARMALLAEKIDARTAFEWGMISHVVANEDYESEFDRIAMTLAAGPTLSYGWIKKALRASTLTELPTVQDIEVAGQEILHGTRDFREGMRSFRARTRPEFRGQ